MLGFYAWNSTRAIARTTSNCSSAMSLSCAIFFSYILSILVHLKHVMDWSQELGVLRNNDQLCGHFQNQQSVLLKNELGAAPASHYS